MSNELWIKAGFFNAGEREEIIHAAQHDACRFTIVGHANPTLQIYDAELLVGRGAKSAGVVANLYADVNERGDDTNAAEDLSCFLQGHWFLIILLTRHRDESRDPETTPQSLIV